CGQAAGREQDGSSEHRFSHLASSFGRVPRRQCSNRRASPLAAVTDPLCCNANADAPWRPLDPPDAPI
ncbi:MAG TPA: hypothetical protein PK177_21740, partial [Burkholderiaceae bacterium]|nr:hypothetical protein [Burkholderiaceae bacterium]